MAVNIELIVAFVTGAILPLLVALLGKEPIGRWLMARQSREDTALGALIDLAKESVAGWRESNTAVMNLSDAMKQGNRDSATRNEEIRSLMLQQSNRLQSVDARLTSLVQILSDGDV